MSNLFTELKRRNVFRVAGLYLVVAWLLLQAAALLEGALNLPEWFDGLVTALVLLGFPVALLLAWAFELTPDGVRRTRDSESGDTPTRVVDGLLVGLLAVVAVLLVWDRVSPPARSGAGPGDTVAAAAKGDGATREAAVAVLPFRDLSPKGDQDYFSDGLAEEILNVLARESSIRVAGRTSSFAFKGKTADVQEIARALNVTHVLEGSVRKSGDRIRVTASLLDASSGFPVFSESYDRKVEDIFSVQDDIAKRIGRALEIRLTLSNRGALPDPGAYEDYLAARELLYTRQVAKMLQAETLLERAQARAPEYAPIYATRAVVTMLLSNMPGGYGTRPAASALPKAKKSIERALELDPELADAHAALGLYRDSAGEGDPVPPLRRALELNPNHTDAQLWLSSAQADSPASFAVLERLTERDPAFMPAVANLAGHYTLRQEYDRARALLQRTAAVLGPAAVKPNAANIAIAEGELADAYRLASEAHERSPVLSNRLMLGFSLVQLGALERAEDLGTMPTDVAVALLRRDDARVLELLASAPPSAMLAELAAPAFIETESYRELVDYFEKTHESLDETNDVRNLHSALANLIVAYRALGMDERAERLGALARRSHEIDRELGYATSPVRLASYAELEAALGRREEAASALRRAIDAGLNGAFSRSAVLERVLPPESIESSRQVLNERVNAERAKLGWPPYEPPADEG